MAHLAGGASGVTSSFKSRNTDESSKSAASIKEIGKGLIDEISSDTNKVKSELTNAQINLLQDQMEDTLVSRELVDLLNEFNPESADPDDQEDYRTLLNKFNNLVNELKENPERRQELIEKIIIKKAELQDFISDVDPTEYKKHEKLENENNKKLEDLRLEINDAVKKRDDVINKYEIHTIGQEAAAPALTGAEEEKSAAPQKTTAPCCTVS